jgi:hypothetical protein
MKMHSLRALVALVGLLAPAVASAQVTNVNLLDRTTGKKAVVNSNGSINVNCLTGCGGSGPGSTVDQGAPAALSSGWPVKVTDGTSVLGVTAHPIVVSVANGTVAVSSVAGTVLVDGSGHTQPVSGTFWQAVQPISATALPLPAGAATESTLATLATAATQTDGTQKTRITDGSQTANVTGTSLDVNCTSGCGGTPATSDNSVFLVGTSGIAVAGGVFDDGLAGVTSGNAAAPRITANRALHENLRDASGTEIKSATSAPGSSDLGLVVRNIPSGTQPVSGTVAVSSVAGSVAVTGPVTDTQLRASPVPVSGPLTDTQLRASAVAVDASGSTVPVSGPLTDTQLRAAAVPVSASALPLPAGASTEATLALIKAKTDNIDVALSTRTKPADTQTVGGTVAVSSVAGSVAVTGPLTDTQLRASAVAVDASGSTVPVSGPLTNTQLRASAVPVDASGSTVPISATALPLPAGAATSVKQPAFGTAGTASADVLTVQGKAGMTAVVVDGSGVTQPVSGPVTDAQLRATPVPVSGTVTATVNNGSGASAVNIQDGGNSITVDGTVTTSPPANASTNVAQFGGSNVVTGTGTGGAGIPRVTVSSDSTVTANAGTNLNTSALALDATVAKDATLTGGTAKAIARGGAKGATAAADVTSTANGVDHQGLDVTVQGTVPVSGTVAATQSGTWTVQPGNTANTTAWKVDGSAVTQPISGTVTANAGSNLNTSALALSATQTDRTQKTQLTDGASDVGVSTVGGAKALKVDVIQTVGGGGSGTSSTYGAAFPATGTAAGFINSAGNMTGAQAQTTAPAGTEVGLVTRNIPSGTQPVSNAGLSNLDVALSTRLKPADTLAAVTTVGTITNPVAVTNSGLSNLDVALSTRTKPADQQHALLDSGSTTTVTQATGTNLHAVLDATSTTTVTQATGTNLHTTLDSGTLTSITNQVDENLKQVGGTNVSTAASGVQKVGMSDSLAQAIYNFPSGSLRVMDEPSQLFEDPFDTSFDSTNRWVAVSTFGSGTGAFATDHITMSSGTIATGWAQTKSQASFAPTAPSWLGCSIMMGFESGTPVSGAGRYIGFGTPQAAPTAGSPVLNGVGFYIGSDGKMWTVLAINGTTNLITDLSAATGNAKQPTDGNYHKYFIYQKAGFYVFYIDTLDTPVSSLTLSGKPQIQTNPITMVSAASATSQPTAATFAVREFSVFDTGHNNSQLSDGTFPWRKAQVSSANALKVDGSAVTQPVSGSITATGSGNFTVVQPTGTSLHAVIDSGTISISGVAGTLTDNNAAPGATNIGSLDAIANKEIRSLTEGNQTLLSVNKEGALRVQKQNPRWYHANGDASVATPATATAFACITGSATTLVKLRRIQLSTTITTAANLAAWSIDKFSSANTGGTKAQIPLFPIDSNSAAATVTAFQYSVKPTSLGVGVGHVWWQHYFIPAPATVWNPIVIDYNPGDDPVVLRGVAESVCVMFGGGALPTGLANPFVSFDWTEE